MGLITLSLKTRRALASELMRDYGFDKWEAYMMLSQCGKVRLGSFVDPKYTTGAGIGNCI